MMPYFYARDKKFLCIFKFIINGFKTYSFGGQNYSIRNINPNSFVNDKKSFIAELTNLII
tara:strand:- start:262 stop:441 length:180 start_codon:yes stop_codon:yes gene_type:complete